MKRITTAVSAALAALLLMAIVASAAQATEGPHYKVGGKVLKAGETREFKAAIKETFRLTAGTATIECKALKVKPGAVLIGQGEGSNKGDTSSEVLEFTECSITGNGAGCKVKGSALTTEPVTNELGYSEARSVEVEKKVKFVEGKGKVLVLFKPTTGSVFVKFQLEGEGCTPFKEKENFAIEGSVDGEAQTENAAKELPPVLVGSEPAEAEKGFVGFPATKIGREFYEEGKEELKEKVASMKAFGKAVSVFTGKATITVFKIEEKKEVKENYCITTKAAGSKC